VYADRTLIKEAVGNLLTNAVSFASEGSSVSVTLEHDEPYATIRVSNKGPLIESDPDVLFGAFASTRAEPSSEHHGLGLYLVRLIAHHHGGKATIGNLKDGSGVAACIWLPAVS
jgi:signal transduction histidine kinase